MGKIQEYRDKLQQVSHDNEIIKYIGKIDGYYFYLVDYTEDVGCVGPPRILEIDSKNPDYVTTHCSIEFYSQLVNRSQDLLEQANNPAGQHHYLAPYIDC